MNEADGFLADICARPDDDTPRLVYADWLEDNGQPERAELIRVQCELAREPEEPARYRELLTRQHELLSTHASTWLGPLAEWRRRSTRPFFDRWKFRRGMLWGACRTAQFLVKQTQAMVAEWFPRAGLVELSLQGKAKRISDLPACPLLARLHSLEICEASVQPEAIRALVTSPNLTGLSALSLSDCRASAAATRALAQAVGLRRLRSLRLQDIRDGGALDACRVLTESGVLGRLTVLALPSNRLGAQDVQPLFDSPDAAGLTELDLSDNRLDWEGAMALARCPHLRRLRTLDIRNNGIGPEGASALLSSSRLEELCDLSLQVDDIDSGPVVAQVQAVAEHPGLARLTRLSLRAWLMDEEAARVLAASPHIRGLRALDLTRCCLGGAGLQALASSPNLAGLRQLWLDYGRGGEKDILAFTRSEQFAGLLILKARSRDLNKERRRALNAAFHGSKVTLGIVFKDLRRGWRRGRY
jgi:uncharacterized protein (TIGR02996 family)